MYVLNKHIAAPELNILGKPETPPEIPTSRAYWGETYSNIGAMVPTHAEFIKYLKHIKVAALVLGLFVTTITVLIYYIWGTLNGAELGLFILGLIVFLVQMFHMSIKALAGVDDRHLKMGKEMMELADEMEKEGLITRDSEDSEDGFFSNLAK
jgi:hypothetical protein